MNTGAQERAPELGTRAPIEPHPVFPLVRDPAVALAIDIERQLAAHSRLDRAAQQAQQSRQLGYLLTHAMRRSAYWRDTLEKLLENNKGRSAFPLSEMPILTRETLQRDAAAMRIDLHAAGNKVRVMRTSGSTGTPVEVLRYAPVEAPLYRAITRLDLRWHPADESRPVAVIKDVAQRAIDRMSARTEGREGLPAVHVMNMVEHSPEALLRWLLEIRPDDLITTPTMAAELARLASAAGERLEIGHVRTFAEPVGDELRRAVREAFGAKVVDRYSCEEFGWLALQCPKHDHLHVMTSNVIIEVVHDDGRPCKVGEAGRVLVTGLHGYAMPLLRYDIGDVAEVGAPCDCGVTLPVLRRVHGRERSFILMPDGSKRLARLTGEYWREIAPVDEYRVVQYADGSIEAFVRCERGLSSEELLALREMLARVLSFPATVRVTQVNQLAWPSRWKRVDLLRLEHTRQRAIDLGLVPDPAAPSGV